MPLKKTIALLDPIKERLINGSISDEEIINLLDPKTFTPSPGVKSFQKPVDDLNHNRLDMMRDFMLVVGPSLSPEILHNLTARVIDLAPQCDMNTFMRNTTLEKMFLSYEMARQPKLAEQHFASKRMKAEIKDADEVQKLKNKMLKPNVDFFKEQLVNDFPKVKQLFKLCVEYQDHLKQSLAHLNFEKGTQPKNQEDCLAIKKFKLVQQMINKLKEDKVDYSRRINNMMKILTPENKKCLEGHRNSSVGGRFLENIFHIITLGIYSKLSKGSFSFWKTHGEVLCEQVEHQANLK